MLGKCGPATGTSRYVAAAVFFGGIAHRGGHPCPCRGGGGSQLVQSTLLTHPTRPTNTNTNDQCHPKCYIYIINI